MRVGPEALDIMRELIVVGVSRMYRCSTLDLRGGKCSYSQTSAVAVIKVQGAVLKNTREQRTGNSLIARRSRRKT